MGARVLTSSIKLSRPTERRNRKLSPESVTDMVLFGLEAFDIFDPVTVDGLGESASCLPLFALAHFIRSLATEQKVFE